MEICGFRGSGPRPPRIPWSPESRGLRNWKAGNPGSRGGKQGGVEKRVTPISANFSKSALEVQFSKTGDSYQCDSYPWRSSFRTPEPRNPQISIGQSGASLGAKEGKNYGGRDAPRRTTDSHLKRSRGREARRADPGCTGRDFGGWDIRRLRKREVGSSGGSELEVSGGPGRSGRRRKAGSLEKVD